MFKAKEDQVLGFIKVGLKKLFLRDALFNYHEVTPLCVLDFYVHETIQRQGLGKQLFEYMLNFEKKNAKELAYDRPSPKLISFLRKHYGLADYLKQNNNFIVFDEFFQLVPNDYNRNQSLNGYLNCGNSANNYYNINESNYSQQSLGKTEFPGGNLSNVGKQLICKLLLMIIIDNNRNDNGIVNRNVYSNPITGFKSYYFNRDDTVSYDNIYSKKKMNLINDYLTSIQNEPDSYLKEQLDMKNKSIEDSNGRLNQLMSKISPVSNQMNMFNKRNEFATVFDDKKILERAYYANNINRMKNLEGKSNNLSTVSDRTLQHYSPFSQNGKVFTNILPTTSSAYGAYYNNQQDLNKREQSPNKLYY